MRCCFLRFSSAHAADAVQEKIVYVDQEKIVYVDKPYEVRHFACVGVAHGPPLLRGDSECSMLFLPTVT